MKSWSPYILMSSVASRSLTSSYDLDVGDVPPHDRVAYRQVEQLEDRQHPFPFPVGFRRGLVALLEPGAVVRDVAGLPGGDQVAVAPQALHFFHAEQILDDEEAIDLEPGDLVGGQPVQRHWR